VGSKRTLILVAAVLVGVLAAYALYTYVNGVEDRAYENAALVEVYVVKQTVPQNTDADTAIRNKLIARDKIPQEFRPATAITDLTVLSGKVAQVELTANQVLVSGMFADATKVYGTFSERIPTGEVAVSVAVDQVHGVAGLLVPGDEVNLMVLLEEADAGLEGGQESSTKSGDGKGIQYLYQKTKILAVGQSAEVATADGAPAQAAGSGLITFSVKPDAAQRIALAAEAGSLYLSLAPRDYTPAAIPGVNVGSLFETDLTPSAAASPA
jgi:pilus assembly protein CpaB